MREGTFFRAAGQCASFKVENAILYEKGMFLSNFTKKVAEVIE